MVTAVCFNWSSKIMGSISHWGEWKRSSIHRRYNFTYDSSPRQSKHTEHASTHNKVESKSCECFESLTNTWWYFRLSSICLDWLWKRKHSTVYLQNVQNIFQCSVVCILNTACYLLTDILIQPLCWQRIAIDSRNMFFSHHWSRRCGWCKTYKTSPILHTSYT